VRVRDLNNPTVTETESFTIQVAGSAAEVHYVDSLYATLLGRAAGDADLAYWVDLLQGGVARQQVTQAIWESAEHRGLEVDQLYDNYLHRSADAAGRGFWANALLGGTSEEKVAEGLLMSTEYLQAHAGAGAYVTGVYADVLGRAPDAVGLDFWRAASQNGVSPAEIADHFLGSLKAAERRVDGYYQTYLGHDADAAGTQMWLSLLQSGQLTPAQVAQAFLAPDEFFARAAGGLGHNGLQRGFRVLGLDLDEIQGLTIFLRLTARQCIIAQPLEDLNRRSPEWVDPFWRPGSPSARCRSAFTSLSRHLNGCR
jgi:hypothetical protein